MNFPLTSLSIRNRNRKDESIEVSIYTLACPISFDPLDSIDDEAYNKCLN